MRVIFSKYAALELRDAASYYEFQVEGLGIRFRGEIKKAVGRILDFPEAWPIERGEVRRCILSKFPYKILYSIEPDHIFIIAVAHTHRRPDYWIDREEK
jgi:plasmid stabilization system protein ParE